MIGQGYHYQRQDEVFKPIKKGDITVALFSVLPFTAYAALNNLCGSITNFFGTPASNSP
ncbi:hypothetical protein SRABI06_02130 [Pseudomonas brassicacearum]|nr:hypothetical protein SRABI06_02130 [Pseudomonas brassicacearum]